MMKKVYLLPGRCNSLSDIGDIIQSISGDVRVIGREFSPAFSTRRFPNQLSAIKQDLRLDFWNSDAKLIGHSYGGYLLMHALAEMPSFPGMVLLFSPVLGAATNHSRTYESRPPRAKKLFHLVETEAFPPPRYLEIHTGALDAGCEPGLAEKIARQIPNAQICILEDKGHQLGDAYIWHVLKNFFQN